MAEGLSRIRRADPGFDPSQFLEGARSAFEMIVAAYAKGDKAGLRPLLSDEVYRPFAATIDERAAAKETFETRDLQLDDAEIVDADVSGRTARVTVKLVSHQVNVTRAMDGSIVDGDPEHPVEKTDHWTFARDTRSPIRTGCSSPPAAADAWRRRRWRWRAATVAAIAALAVGLARDAGPTRLTLTPVGFDRLDGWGAMMSPRRLRPFSNPARGFRANLPRHRSARSRSVSIMGGSATGGRPVAVQLWRGRETSAAARRFFESAFIPMAVADYGGVKGLFTGYFEIALHGSLAPAWALPDADLPAPPDLATGPRYTRAQIEDGALAGRGLALLWVDDPIDAFFLQIQGSGQVRLDDGEPSGSAMTGRTGCLMCRSGGC